LQCIIFVFVIFATFDLKCDLPFLQEPLDAYFLRISADMLHLQRHSWELEDENGRLKKIVAGMSSDQEFLQDVIKRKL